MQLASDVSMQPAPHTPAVDSRLHWWDASPEIYRQINRRITGEPEYDWKTYTLDKYFAGRLPVARTLSLGCGIGRLERTLAKLGAFEQCDAYDISPDAIATAAALTQARGIRTVAFHAADVNTLILPARVFDAVWAHSALHHFAALEHIFGQIRRALKPGGLLILNEYVGPSRFQFPERQKEIINLCLRLLPPAYRTLTPEAAAAVALTTPFNRGPRWALSRLADKARDGNVIATLRRRIETYAASVTGRCRLKERVTFPTAHDVAAFDSSEAVRSDEIVGLLKRDFDIVEQKALGGNILQFMLADIAGNFTENDPHSQALLKMIVHIEETFIVGGEFESDYVYIVARPRPE